MANNDDNAVRWPLLQGGDRGAFSSSAGQQERQWRKASKDFLSSKTKHYIIMLLVALDVASILADIFIALISCDMGQESEQWVEDAREGLHITGTVFSSLFLVELIVAIWAYGPVFFRDWFHCFDAFVIVASFIVDLLAHGVVEEIASLVIMLRLWRFVKIVEELSVGAAERMDEIQEKLDDLGRENLDLREQLRSLRGQDWADDDTRDDR